MEKIEKYNKTLLECSPINRRTMSCPPGKFEVLINTDYGGFETSDEVDELYTFRTGKKYDDDREDLVMIQIYKEVGSEHFGGDVSLEYIENKYRGFYEIIEYDGLESIQIDESAYKLDLLKTKIQELIDSSDSDSIPKEYLKKLIE